MKNFIQAQDGMVAVFSALVLPVLLLVGVFVLDSGQLYMRHGQLQHLARQAANSGILAFGEILRTRAETNYSTLCDVEFPPSICSSSNRFDFLTAAEIQLLAHSLTTQSSVINAVQTYAKQYDPELVLGDENMSVDFPFENDPAAQEIKILVAINDQAPGILVAMLPQTRTVRVEAESFMSFNP